MFACYYSYIFQNMILYINTINNQSIEIALKQASDIIVSKNIPAPYKQAELLLPEIDKILKKQKINLKDITKIEVEDSGGTFTSLRIGIITANALAYALNIPVQGINEKIVSRKKIKIVKPKYNAEPSVS